MSSEKENSKFLTHKELKSILRYNPKTGKWFWLSSMNRQIKIGKEAGWVSTRDFYPRITIKHRWYMAHRLAWFYMTGKWPSKNIDHKDRNKENCKWKNLREATHSQNLGNAKLHTHNKSGYKGVFFYKRTGKWIATIAEKQLGYFSSKRAAIAARKKAAKERFGEFAS